MSTAHLAAGTPTGVRGSRAQPPGHRPTWVEVDSDAIAANVGVLKDASTAPLLLAAVKADGYGHGLLQAARAALRGGADWLGVALIEEAEQLRAGGVECSVLMLNEPAPSAVPAMIAAGVTPTVYTPDFIDALDEHGRTSGGPPVDVHLKLDTGMGRVGVPEGDWDDALRRVRDAAGVRLQGLMSHLAVADDPDDAFTARQGDAFARGVALADRLGVPPAIRHLVNSAGLFTTTDHWDMTRPGIAVYGLDPGRGLLAGTGLSPALTWWTRVSLVKRVAAGDAIGYGRTWTAPRATTVATVPVGYGDGLRRSLSNVGEVVLGGMRIPITGRVSMDQTLLTVPDELSVAVGDEVALIGSQTRSGGSGPAAVTADDWAEWLGTINYEITTGIAARVPRVHLGSAHDGDAAAGRNSARPGTLPGAS